MIAHLITSNDEAVEAILTIAVAPLLIMYMMIIIFGRDH